MDTNKVIKELRARCPIFSGRVGGVAEIAQVMEAVNATLPAAYVIREKDEAMDSESMQVVRQPIIENLTVAVVISNRADEVGRVAQAQVDDFRAALIKVLAGWRISDEHDMMWYQGFSMYSLDRARAVYEFRFDCIYHTPPDQTRQHQDWLDLPEIDGIDVKVDVIDPITDTHMTPAYHGGRPGPDGRVEFQFGVDMPPKTSE